MKTKEQIKNEYAVSEGYSNWWHLETMNIHEDNFSKHVDEAMEIYAMECLKLASDKFRGFIDKDLITNENNIIK